MLRFFKLLIKFIPDILIIWGIMFIASTTVPIPHDFWGSKEAQQKATNRAFGAGILAIGADIAYRRHQAKKKLV